MDKDVLVKSRWKKEQKRRALTRAKKRFLAQSSLPKGEQMMAWDHKLTKIRAKKAERRVIQKKLAKKTREVLAKVEA